MSNVSVKKRSKSVVASTEERKNINKEVYKMMKRKRRVICVRWKRKATTKNTREEMEERDGLACSRQEVASSERSGKRERRMTKGAVRRTSIRLFTKKMQISKNRVSRLLDIRAQ